LLVRSKTGSGKTHAFLIPIFNNLDESKQIVQAVIVSPTKELAMQTYKVAQHIASFSPDTISIKLYSGGSDREREIESLKSNQPQIVVATPGKIKDLAVETNVLKIYTSSYYIVDEVDMALDSGYAEDLDAVAAILKDSKMMFFSATISEKILPFVKKYLDSPEYININNQDNLDIKHIWIPLKYRSRNEMLLNLMSVINPYLCIIFANKKNTVIEVANFLRENGYKVGEIHGDLQPRERKRLLSEANALKYQYIVASDLAARGIDIDGVSHIINYEIPKDFEFYVHRSGRTGRMNYTGIVYSFYDELDNVYLDNLSKKGIVPEYKVIKDGELVDFKGRNTRQDRKKPINDVQKKAKSFVQKPKKVTPGYKKKMQAKIDEVASKIYQSQGRRKKRK
ncbi:MAG: DEAD/DEAH box helicase, partial [Anaeroplasmataceae bacterium]